MLNNSGPRYKRSELERLMNWDIVWCVVILLVMCVTGAIGSTIWLNSYGYAFNDKVPFLTYVAAQGQDEAKPGLDLSVPQSPDFEGFLNFWTYVIVLQVMIPISLYVTLEMVKLGQIYFIVQDRDLYHESTDKTIQCRALNIPEELGQIQYVLSDKTGTLTENQMIFRRCAVGGVDYGPPGAKTDMLNNSQNGPENVWDVTPNAELQQMVHDASHENIGFIDSSLSMEAGQRERHGTFEFLLNMAICNTVVVNSRHHHDNMTASGYVVPADTSGAQLSAVNRSSQVCSRSSSMNISMDSLQRSNAGQLECSSRLPTLLEVESPSTRSAEFGDTDSIAADGMRSPIQHVHTTPGELWNMKDPPSDPTVLHVQTARRNSDTPRNDRNIHTDSGVISVPPLSVTDASPTPSPPPPDPAPSEDEERPPSTGDTSQKGETTRGLSSSRTFPLLTRPSSLLRLPVNTLKSSLSSGLSPILRGRKNLLTTLGQSARSDSPAPPLNPIYEAESPDELSLVHAAAAYGVRLLTRQINKATVEMPTGARVSYEVLATLPFDSDRKCMSVVVRTPHSRRPILYCKGADAQITQLLSDDFVNSERGMGILYKSQQYLSLYSSYGLRTLCLAKRELTESEYARWAELHREAEADIENREELIYESALRIERNLELLGVTGIEDRLQDGVPECIAALRHAGIKVWVLTGDKIETAVNIAYASRLFSPGMELLQLKASTQEATAELLDIHVQRLAHRAFMQPCARHASSNRSLQGVPSSNVPVNDAAGHSRSQSAGAALRQCNESGALLDARLEPTRTHACTQTTTRRTVTAEQRRARRHEKIGVVVDGRTLAFCLQDELQDRFSQIVSRCTSVLCCRSTPLQKASVVRLAKEKLKGKTLAIGDGANDVSMIQCADVGVGISGQEGMQAVMASDFALARFRFLRRLLLVHGHWCYDRLARTVLYFFYKNGLFVFTIFWYQLFCGFSGQVMIDQIYLMFYNLLFTSLPPLLLGIFDQAASDQLLMEQPRLYTFGRTSMGYRWHSFWCNILDALWQSIVIYFVAHFTYYMSDADMWSFGFLVTTALVIINQLHLAVEVQSWTLPLLGSIVFSVLLFFGFALVYHEIVQPTWGVPDLPVSVDRHAMGHPKFWLCILLMIVLSLLPRFTVLTLANMNHLSNAQMSDVIFARYRRQTAKQQRQKSKFGGKMALLREWWSRDRTVKTVNTYGVVPDPNVGGTADNNIDLRVISDSVAESKPRV